MDNKITVSILTHRCQCPHDRLKRGGDRGGATNIHKRKLSSEPHVKKRYKWRNHLFYTPDRKVWVHFWNREPMVVTGSPVWLGAVGAFRSYRLPNSAGIDILSPNFLIHHFNTQNRELKVVSIPEGPDRIYGAVC